jgi:hypothetical protein
MMPEKLDLSIVVKDFEKLSKAAVDHKSELDRHSERRVGIGLFGVIRVGAATPLLAGLYNILTSLAVSSGAGTAVSAAAGAKVIAGAASIATSLSFFATASLAVSAVVLGILALHSILTHYKISEISIFNKLSPANQFKADPFNAEDIDNPIVKWLYEKTNILDRPRTTPKEPGKTGWSINELVNIGSIAVAVGAFVVATAMPAIAPIALTVLAFSLALGLLCNVIKPAVAVANLVVQTFVIRSNKQKDQVLCDRLEKKSVQLESVDLFNEDYATKMIKPYGRALRDASRSSTCRAILYKAAETLVNKVLADENLSPEEKEKFTSKIMDTYHADSERMKLSKGVGTEAFDIAGFDRELTQAKFDQLQAQTPTHSPALNEAADLKESFDNPLHNSLSLDFDKMDQELDQELKALADKMPEESSPPADPAPDSPQSSFKSAASQEPGGVRAADAVQKFQTRTDDAVSQAADSNEDQTPSSLRP